MEQRGVFYRHFDLPVSFPVIGLLGPTWQGEHMRSFRMHFHNCLEIGYMYQGEAIYYLNDQEIPVKAPCVTIAPPHAPHMMNAKEGVICGWKWLYVDPVQLLHHLPTKTSAMLSTYQYQLQGSECILSPECDSELCDMIGLIIRLMEKGQGDWQGSVKGIFQAFFLMLLSSHPLSEKTVHNDRYEGILAPAVAEMMEEYMHDLTIHELAVSCHLSDTHFRRVFKKIYGMGPLEYLHTIRIGRACALLFDGEKSISEIADSVGYTTPSTFTRQFNHFYGMSPSQWRMKMASEENEVVVRYFHSLPPAVQKFFPDEYLEQLGNLNPFAKQEETEEKML